MRLALFGEHHVDYAHSLAALAEVYTQQGDLDQGQCDSSPGPRDPPTLAQQIYPVIAASLSAASQRHPPQARRFNRG